ncbi:MAG: amino acid permease, partial [Synergistetes bacterium HGW-Synergistetes-2]
MNRNLNVWTLAGFLVGPVLGSGVVLLPPLALEKAGEGAFSAWVITLVLMGVFAGVCAALALRFPGDGGLTTAVGAA